ncbi:MAG: hypothetical protein K0R88_605 [Solirubrobacterales bacterium]|nr:hypothetical protein [Solirubrobacterales bacterium]
MKARLSLALIACVVGASLPGIAIADRPELEVLSPVGDQIACDGTVLTVSSGLVVGRIHEHELPSGRVRDIGNFVNRDVRAMDGEGTVYRLVGGIRHNFTIPVNINVVGPGGLFGKVKSIERRKPNGDEVFRDKGTCQFVEDDEE